MHMLYNSDSFAVVLFDVPGTAPDRSATATDAGPHEALTHGGYEIVDKFARKEIFIQGALAESFKEGVQALIDTEPSVDEMDAYIERFSSLMQQPLVVH